MGRFNDEALADIFSYHTPNDEQIGHYKAIREKARELATVIVAHTPESADQTAALRKLREVVMTANSSIALGGKY